MQASPAFPGIVVAVVAAPAAALRYNGLVGAVAYVIAQSARKKNNSKLASPNEPMS